MFKHLFNRFFKKQESSTEPAPEDNIPKPGEYYQFNDNNPFESFKVIVLQVATNHKGEVWVQYQYHPPRRLNPINHSSLPLYRFNAIYNKIG